MTDIDPYERIIAATGDHQPDGLYESNYLKANAPDRSAALWLKHNILLPAAATGAPPVAEFWFVLWHRRQGFTPTVWKRVVDLEQVELGARRLWLRSDVARLAPEHVDGAIETTADGAPTSVRWTLDIADELAPVHHYPSPWMYERSFPRTKTLAPSPRAVVHGELTIDAAGDAGGSRTVDVDGWIGYRGHNWGTEHAHVYAHGNCNLWDDTSPAGRRSARSDLTVSGSTARAQLGAAVTTPWVTLLGGRDRGVDFGASSLWQVFKQAGSVEWPRWFAYGGGRSSRVRLEMQLDPAHAAGLRYLHPDGDVSYCYNVKDAHVDLLLSGEPHTSTAGELEFLFPEPLDGIPLHGHASLAELTQAVNR